MTHPTDAELDALVTRLQGTPLYEGHGEASDAPDEAAAAITTLRAQLTEANARIAAQEAVIKRLEAALVKINVGEGWAAQIAREALRGVGHEPS